MTSYGGRERLNQAALCSRIRLLVQTCGGAALLLVAACASTGQANKTPVGPSAAVASTQQGTLAAKPPHLPARAHLPPEAREMLTDRMMRHGDDMGDLTVAVLMLEYDLTQALAAEMAGEPKLGRPAPGETGTLNALLPKEFFTQQDALTASAKALSMAAEKRDDTSIAASFGEVAKACVSCHSAYLNAELDPPAHVADERTRPCNPEEACGEDEAR